MGKGGREKREKKKGEFGTTQVEREILDMHRFVASSGIMNMRNTEEASEIMQANDRNGCN